MVSAFIRSTAVGLRFVESSFSTMFLLLTLNNDLLLTFFRTNQIGSSFWNGSTSTTKIGSFAISSNQRHAIPTYRRNTFSRRQAVGKKSSERFWPRNRLVSIHLDDSRKMFVQWYIWWWREISVNDLFIKRNRSDNLFLGLICWK